MRGSTGFSACANLGRAGTPAPTEDIFSHPKMRLVVMMPAKLSLASPGVPKYNLGTRIKPAGEDARPTMSI